MAGDRNQQPIIVKRVKKAAHGHYGGAWKIAYADFVTAMMAFFLLMWLLGSTSEGDKKGIADYFNTPLKVALLHGGSGSGDSSHIIKGGGTDLTSTSGQVKNGEVDAARSTINLQALKEAAARAEAERLAGLRARVEQSLANNPRLAAFRSQILLDITRDGLRIQILDAQNRAMFDSGSAVVKDHTRAILREIGAVLGEVSNKVTLAGHTDAAPYGRGEHGYSNWELSADRANASRRELLAGGLREDQVLRVIGMASSSLLERAEPLAPVNRRISIIVMNREAEERFERGGEVEGGNGEGGAPVDASLARGSVPLEQIAVRPAVSSLPPAAR